MAAGNDSNCMPQPTWVMKEHQTSDPKIQGFLTSTGHDSTFLPSRYLSNGLSLLKTTFFSPASCCHFSSNANYFPDIPIPEWPAVVILNACLYMYLYYKKVCRITKERWGPCFEDPFLRPAASWSTTVLTGQEIPEQCILCSVRNRWPPRATSRSGLGK